MVYVLGKVSPLLSSASHCCCNQPVIGGGIGWFRFGETLGTLDWTWRRPDCGGSRDGAACRISLLFAQALDIWT